MHDTLLLLGTQSLNILIGQGGINH